jgi:hypothetical protein
VKNRFQNLPFKCNLQRYTSGRGVPKLPRRLTQDAVMEVIEEVLAARWEQLTNPDSVRLCTLNQVDPQPITYNLSSEKTGFKVCLSNATCSATTR